MSLLCISLDIRTSCSFSSADRSGIGAGWLRYDHLVRFERSAGLPAELCDRLAATVARVLASDRVIAVLRPQGIEPLVLGPEAFARYVTDETAQWAGLVAEASLAKR